MKVGRGTGSATDLYKVGVNDLSRAFELLTGDLV